MILRVASGTGLLLWAVGAVAGPLAQTPPAMCANQSGDMEAEVIAFFPEGESCNIECRWLDAERLEVIDSKACSPDLLVRSRKLGAAVVDRAAWSTNKTALVVKRK
jgi:hypothetical protein